MPTAAKVPARRSSRSALWLCLLRRCGIDRKLHALRRLCGHEGRLLCARRLIANETLEMDRGRDLLGRVPDLIRERVVATGMERLGELETCRDVEIGNADRWL